MQGNEDTLDERGVTRTKGKWTTDVLTVGFFAGALVDVLVTLACLVFVDFA